MNYDDSNWPQLFNAAFVRTLNESMQLQFAQSLYILALMSHRTLNETLVPFAQALNELNSNSSVVWPYVIGKLRQLMAPIWANQSASRDALMEQICDGISSIGQRVGLKAPSPLSGWTPSLQGQVLAAEAFFVCAPAYRPLSSLYLQAKGNLSSPLLPPFIWPVRLSVVHAHE